MNEEKCQQYTTRIGYFVYSTTCTHILVIIYAVSYIAIGNYDTSSWPLLFNYATPFSTATILNWFFMWIVQVNESLGYSRCMTCVTSYYVSCCNYINAMCDHFDLIMEAMRLDLERNQIEKSPRTIEKVRLSITGHFIETVKLHIHILE